MVKTVRDVCELNQIALNYVMSEQIENLSDVTDKTAQDAAEFFSKNYVTAGMETLLRQGLKRLAGGDTQAVFELKQAMGGGKTHSMVALGLLARDASLRQQVVPQIATDASFDQARVVAVNGRLGFEEHFIWGEIATQLGKAAAFAKFWKDGPKAPSEKDWIDLIGDEPVLILLDELPPYFDYAVTRAVGGGTLAQVATFALSNLLSAALKLKRCCVVISNLSGTYAGATKQLSQAIHNMQQEANRQAKAIVPVELASQEIYEILRKRLFRNLPDRAVIDSVASAYGQVLSEAVKAKSIAKSAEQIAEEVYRSYPFHPSVKHVIALFKENESFRQTRGLMQFAAKMIKSVWQRPTDDVYLIGCQHLALNVSDVRDEINNISNLQGAIATDVAAGGSAHAEVVDANLNSDAASQVAALILTASLSESVDAVKGLTKPQLLECLAAPMRPAQEFQQAFEALRADAWYLHRKENDAWYFSNTENLRKRIDNRARNAPQPKIDAEMKRRLEDIFRVDKRIAYQEVHALPRIDEIRLNGPRVLLVLSPDSKAPPVEAQHFWETVTEKNNVCIVTGDGSDLASLEDKTRRIWAIARVREETGGDKSPHREELDEEAEQAEQDFNSTVINLFNRVYYPMKSGLTPAKLSMTFAGNQFLAEEQVEKTLADAGVSKLIRSIEVNAEMLMTRAEDMLWPASERRIPWRDVVSRSISNPRWLWLPPKGQETLRSIAIGQGRWRYTEDGYIEKGPFPKPKTSVSVSERDYNDATGAATIEVTARDAGPNGQVHFATHPNVTSTSPLIRDTIFPTDDTALWFLAVDPDGKHETGEAVPWSNKLTLTHQPKVLPGKRIVELTVVPRGTIRWNTTGANPRDGEIYSGPIELTGDAEMTIYAYAEDNGVNTGRTFVIPKPDQKGPTVDKTKPATLGKKLDFRGNAEAFAAINAVKALQARVGGASIDIGEGTRNVSTRFGSDSVITADHLDQFIATARETIEDPTADVKLSFRELRFASGYDLETFLAKLGIEIGAGEVDQ